MDDVNFLTVSEIAEKYNIAKSSIFSWKKKGWLAYKKKPGYYTIIADDFTLKLLIRRNEKLKESRRRAIHKKKKPECKAEHKTECKSEFFDPSEITGIMANYNKGSRINGSVLDEQYEVRL